MADFDLDLRSPPSKPSVSRRNLFYRPLVLDFLPSHTEEHLSKFYFLLTLEKQFCSQEMCFLYVRFTVTTTCYIAPFFCAAIRERDCAERLTLKGGGNNQSNNCARLENSIVTLSARLKSSFVQRLLLRADAFSSAARETLERRFSSPWSFTKQHYALYSCFVAQFTFWWLILLQQCSHIRKKVRKKRVLRLLKHLWCYCNKLIFSIS